MEDLINSACRRPASFPALVGGCEEGSRAVLRLARHQYSIHCESSRVAQGTGKRGWAPQTTCGTPKGEIESKPN